MRKALLVAAAAGVVHLAIVSTTLACTRIGPVLPTEMVQRADLIVRVRALGTLAAGPGSSMVRFGITEIIRGIAPPGDLILPGSLSKADDFNDGPVPYGGVRRTGLSGSCGTDIYKEAGDFLLLLQRRQGLLSLNWYALGPVNEQLRGSDDPWLAWVRAEAARPVAPIVPPAAVAPPCVARVPALRADPILGVVKKGERFSETTSSGWIFALDPSEFGWMVRITETGRESEDLSRLTPPLHFVPNPREIDGWHFRNAANTAPNDGSVNAPQRLREFFFSSKVGRDPKLDEATLDPVMLAWIQSDGTGWLHLDAFELTPTRPGTRAAFESMTFSACLITPKSGG